MNVGPLLLFAFLLVVERDGQNAFKTVDPAFGALLVIQSTKLPPTDEHAPDLFSDLLPALICLPMAHERGEDPEDGFSDGRRKVCGWVSLEELSDGEENVGSEGGREERAEWKMRRGWGGKRGRLEEDGDGMKRGENARRGGWRE